MTTATDKHRVHFTSERTKTGRDDWGTPIDLFHRLNAEFGFDLDAAANEANALCDRWLGPGSDIADNSDDAMKVERWWADGPIWLNPPYSMLRLFMQRARLESDLGVTVVCLVPARTDTRAWHDDIMKAAENRLIKGRLRFDGAPAGAPFPSAIVVFRPGVNVPKLSAMGAR